MGDEQHFVYLFEAKGIQRYILDSGPLRDLVGASDLVARLTSSDGEDLLAAVLKAVDLEPSCLSRRAGGAFMAHSSDRSQLERLRALWRLTAGLACPGLEMSDGIAQAPPAQERGGRDPDLAALKAAYEGGSAIRFNTGAELPPAGHPFAAFNPRTGRLATGRVIYRGEIESDVVDAVSAPQRRRAEKIKNRLDGVAAKFLPKDVLADTSGPVCVFPRNLDPVDIDKLDNPPFPFRRRGRGGKTGQIDRRVAVIHADLSGLGQTFRAITQGALDKAAVFAAASAIENVVVEAASAATAKWLLPNADESWTEGRRIIPARPIVLGGDDVTVIVRADLAVPFTQTLLDEIETRSAPTLKALGIEGLPERLSACAGIAFVRAGQPFLMASALAESLCGHAKQKAKGQEGPPWPSMLALHNAQSTLRESYDDIRKREATTPGGVPLTGNPYDLHGRLAQLVALAQKVAAIPGSGKLVDAAQLLFTNPGGAQQTWERWRTVAGAPDALRRLDALLETLADERWAVEGEPPSPTFAAVAGVISDALDLIDFGLIDALGPEQPPAASDDRRAA